MTTEVLAALLRANMIGGAAVLVVLALRIPARRLFGPQVAYGLWAAPPLAAFATLLPARTQDGAQSTNFIAAAVGDRSDLVIAILAAGFLVALTIMIRAQHRFLRAVRAGDAGPAVVGVIAPRILMPRDDGSYSQEERALIRAHEREHVNRMDPRAGAFASALQAVCWFNPLVHVGAHLMRLDQELACDAAVLRHRPRDRALYARTLLKTQLASQPLPFGCYWPARGAHPLEVRIGLLRERSTHDGLLGSLVVVTGLAIITYAGWLAQPPTPPPPAIAELWRTGGGPTMSVMLIRAPAKAE